MRNIWSLLAQGSSVDCETNQVSIFNVLENVTLPGAPPNPNALSFVPLGTVLISHWERAIDDSRPYFLRAQIVNAQDEPLIAVPVVKQIDFKNLAKARTRVQMPVLPIKGEGRYHIVLDVGGTENGPFEEANRIILDVFFGQPETTLAFSR
jgi:hypothetical protein